MARRSIPDIVIGRLPVYLRALGFLIAEGRQITSSQELGDRLGISSAQIRKDLSHFGEFGKQGTGYDINFLYEQLRQILKVNRMWDVVLVGAGNLGKAIADYGGFKGKGFVIKAIFDNDPDKIGKPMGIDNVTVQPWRVGRDHQSPGHHGRHHRHAGGRGPGRGPHDDRGRREGHPELRAHHADRAPHVRVQYIDPVVGLQRMTYYL